MGLGMQMVGWHHDFCAELVQRGFHVVRFDNRDAGRSTHFPGPTPKVGQLLTRRFAPGQYTLADMAADTSGLLSAPRALARARGRRLDGRHDRADPGRAAPRPGPLARLDHVHHRHRFRGQPAAALYRPLLTPAPAGREEFLDHIERLFTLIGSPGRADLEDLRETGRALLRPRPRPLGHAAAARRDPRVGQPHPRAARHQGPHARDARHGRPARAPVGRRRPRPVPSPGRGWCRIEGMGHDLPRAFWKQIADDIAEHAHAADRTAPRPQFPGLIAGLPARAMPCRANSAASATCTVPRHVLSAHSDRSASIGEFEDEPQPARSAARP